MVFDQLDRNVFLNMMRVPDRSKLKQVIWGNVITVKISSVLSMDNAKPNTELIHASVRQKKDVKLVEYVRDDLRR